MEPLLTPSKDRFVLFPIKHPDLWERYKVAEASFWTAEEIDLTQDIVDWKEKLNDNERFFLKNVLAFFAASDGIVNENLAVNFMNEVQYAEARCFYGFQIMMENIHSESYSLLIDTLITNTKEKQEAFNAMEVYPAVKHKADWALKWINSNDFAERLIAFACVEGLMFSSSFSAIHWISTRSLMPGLVLANELISKDEAAHTEFACALFKDHIENKPSRKRILEIVLEALEIEKEFATQAIPVSLIGMNAALMKQYLEFVADGLLSMLGQPKHFMTKNPFDFMFNIALSVKPNFFEKKSSSYSLAKTGKSTENNSISFNEDF